MNYDGSGKTDILTGLTSPQSISLDLQNQKIYWNDATDGTIEVANLDGTDREIIVTTGIPTSIRGIDIHYESERIFWTDRNTFTLNSANLDGTDLTRIIFTNDNPGAVEIDQINNKVYWGEGQSGLIRRMNLNGSGIESFSRGVPGISGIGLSIVEDRTVTAPLSDLYWTDSGTNNISRINRDQSIETVNPSEDNPKGIDIDRFEGRIFYVDGSAKSIKSMNLDGSDITTIFDGAMEPIDVAIDPINRKVYFSDNVANTISRMNYDGSNVEIVTTTPRPETIVLDLGQQKIYWNTFDRFNFNVVNFDGSDRETLFNGNFIGRSFDIDFINDNVYWTDQTNATISRRSLDGGILQDVIFTDTEVTDLKIDARNNRIYWAENVNNRIRSADLNGDNQANVVLDTDSVEGIALAIDNISSVSEVEFFSNKVSPNPASTKIQLETELNSGFLRIRNNLGPVSYTHLTLPTKRIV